jgi:virulence factor Mce-like protein
MIGRRSPSDRPRVLRKDRRGANPFIVGALTLLAVAIGTYFGFTKHVPFTHGFRVKAVFQSANSIRANSPVRIAGVNVGKVKAIERQDGTNAAIVTMEIADKGLPIHKDATLKIRPRIFLEGNFFVDLKPGTPAAPVIDDNDTLPITQTSTPVQLDEVLTALQSDSREDLQAALEGFGTALTAKPTAAEDATQDPSTRGETAAESLNQAVRTGGDALKGTAIVNDALLGTEPHDLSKLIAGLGKVSHALGRNEATLQDLVTNFNTTVAAFASRSSELKQSIHLLAPTLEHADAALTSLNRAFPNTRAFAREILPGVRETPATIKAAFPWIAQTRRLLGPAELQGLSRALQPTTANLSKVVDTTVELLPQADLLSQCVTKVILPTGDQKIDDGPLTSGKENYKEFWYAMVGLAGEGQNFDGNGMYVRFSPGGGDQMVSTGKVGGAAGDVLFGKANSKPLGTRPAYPGKRPPYVSDVPCKDQKVPDLNAAKVGSPDGGGTAAAARSQIARQAAQQSASPSGGLSAKQGSLTAELVSRLNPFRGSGSRPATPRQP